jgi:Protein of unknown function (DUF1592)/Protein of unknown function (DUF1588)/Protein of unknown function (DUF1587)/Protein of unknown function (DUF1585)/Protein of unknown function (DUF1595)/Cytochrome C oxidase, cbb3-type, subunit III
MLAAALLAGTLSGAQLSDSAIGQQFSQTVLPFVAKYCAACHSGASAAAGFDLKSYTTVDMVAEDYLRWGTVINKLSAQKMPPRGMPQPAAENRQAVIAWIQAMRLNEERKNAGDPGPVLPRRLSNAEYDYTIRDLTGVDMHPAKEFPVDPANPAGFENSGESLSMSPTLLKKYLQAARDVADHMVLTPDGVNFAPYPMLVETDREKYTIQRIVNFYLSQPTDYADYFQAAWRYKHRKALGESSATLDSIAAEAKVSAKYLKMVWPMLEEPADAARQEVGPVAKLQAMWRDLPAPGPDAAYKVRDKCMEMRDFVLRIRHDTSMQFAAPVVKGLPAGSQALLDFKLRQFAAHRRDSDPNALRDDDVPPPDPPRIPKYPGLHREAAPRWAVLMRNSQLDDPDLAVPAAGRARYQASFARFANIFPDAFYVKERGRYFPDDSADKGRLLSASYHNVMGYFRDDTPLMELILDENGQKQLNRLWDEFDFIADYTARTWIQYYDNQSGEVDGKGDEAGTLRPDGKAVTDPEIIFGLRDKYVAKANASPTNDPIAVQAVQEHFQLINDTLRRLEKMHKDSEASHLNFLLDFAPRAYRRPLSASERADILAYYHELRAKDEMSHEQAVRESIVAILMSPDFCFRLDLSDAVPVSKVALRNVSRKNSTAVPVRPLSTYSLASRLSYFLWSTMPDQELIDRAASGDLQKHNVLLAQVRRMLKDERARGFVTEFAGNWLDFRQFETYNSVDRQRFPAFNDSLREAMFQEPIHFLQDVIQNDHSLLDLLYGNYTFVNPVLAKHYGMPDVAGNDDTWVRVDDANRYQRGGLLAMSVFMTENSPGLRTSPVKRGYWVVKRVLGETIPPPPPVVPELPSDESKSDMAIRDALAAHRKNPACSGCHQRFDVFGLAFEGYGPVGEARSHDLAGRLVDTKTELPGGIEADGLKGVEDYIREHRQKDFVDNFTRKLLSFALSRSLMLSDEPLIEHMETKLAANGYRFSTLVESIVTSPQFLDRRSTDSTDKYDVQRKGD